MKAFMPRTRAHSDGLILLGLGGILFVLAGFSIEISGGNARGGLLQDFKAVYYSTRCLLQGRNPYLPDEVRHLFLTEFGADAREPAIAAHLQAITYTVYLPSAFLLFAPIALLPWQIAHPVWLMLTAASMLVASYAVWRAARWAGPVFAGIVTALLLAQSFGILWVGNAAGLAVSLCTIAVVCFLRNRFTAPGVLCMTLALAIKPHDTWLLWMGLLLFGASCRRKALWVFLFTLLIGTLGSLWTWMTSPSWPEDLRSNLAVVSGPAGRDYPGPSAIDRNGVGVVVDLRAFFSILRDDARFFTPAAYLLAGCLIAIWAWLLFKAPKNRSTAAIAVAAAAPLMLLCGYHRVWDEGLLLLTVPAAAMLWKRAGIARWLSVGASCAACFASSPFLLLALMSHASSFRAQAITTNGKLLFMVFERPVPLVLLALAVLYLGVLSHERKLATEASVPA